MPGSSSSATSVAGRLIYLAVEVASLVWSGDRAEEGREPVPVVWVEGLRKTYGSTVAVDEVDLSVDEGEVFGILGHNGAGKTTTVECLLGLRTPDRGQVRVLGLNPVRQRVDLVGRVGAQLQSARVQPRLRVGEALALYASFYPHPAPWREVMTRVGLDTKERTAFGKLSGGQQQRLSIALALVGRDGGRLDPP